MRSSSTKHFPFTYQYDGSTSTGGPQTEITFGFTVQNAIGYDLFSIDNSYVSGGLIQTKTTFSSLSLATLGFSVLGEFNSWTLQPANGSDPYTANDTIHWVVGAPVPGPLPLMAAAAAYGWSRRLRKRIGSASTVFRRIPPAC